MDNEYYAHSRADKPPEDWQWLTDYATAQGQKKPNHLPNVLGAQPGVHLRHLHVTQVLSVLAFFLDHARAGSSCVLQD